MTVTALPSHGRWAWDLRGDGRAVRVSAHTEAGLVNLSLWRDDVCVGTARLAPAEAAGLISGISDGLAELAGRPDAAPAADRLHELELRLARLEHRTRTPSWQRALPVLRALARAGVRRVAPSRTDAGPPRRLEGRATPPR